MFETADSSACAFDHEHQRDQRALGALYEVGKLLAHAGDPERALPTVLRVLASFTGLRHGLIARSDGAGALRVVAAARPPVAASLEAALAPVLSGVRRSGVAVVSRDAGAELGPEAVPETVGPEATAALLAVPIRGAEITPWTTGVLMAFRLYRKGAACALAGDLRLLQMVAALVAQGLKPRAGADAGAGDAVVPARTLEPGGTAPPWSIIGESPEIRAVLARIAKVAPTRATVLLRGESGTGKELFADAIHRHSNRRDKPLVKLNCAALSEGLLESELFGHEKGAFTGAVERRKGRFELADGGTLFLDEIGEISPAFQVKLLRALQEGEFERVGGSQTIRVDVRLITATNRDLEAAVVKGQFRADLYFRICVVPITLPPLRERRGDIPPLAQSFLERFNRDNGTRLRFSPRALERLRGCFFPGNIRELENCVNRVATLAAGPVIDLDDLSCVGDACLSPLMGGDEAERVAGAPGLAEPAAAEPPTPAAPPERAAAAETSTPAGELGAGGPAARQRQELVDAMERAGWVQAKAARLLGMTPRQIAYALKKHGIDVVKF